MVTRDGRVKILDFGLAKPMEQTLASQNTRTAISEAGILVGTVGYISPEQIRGLPASPLSDLFSLGLVLREMTTGERAFQRASTIETLNAILKEEVPELPESVPAGLRQIITHCLEKEPERRFQTASDVAFALRSFASTTTTALPLAADASRRWPRTIAYIAGALAAAALFSIGGFFAARTASEPAVDTSALELVPLAVEADAESSPTISPDGRTIAYIRNAGTGDAQIVVRSDNASAAAVVLRGHREARELFWSRDGERIFFFERQGLRSVATIGGEPRDEIDGVIGGHVAPDGRTFAVLMRADASGKQSAQLQVGSLDHLVPYDPQPSAVQSTCIPNVVRFSPDGSKFLIWRTCGENAILILPAPDSSGKGGPARRLFEGQADTLVGGADWLSDSRHIVMSMKGALWLGDTETGARTRLTNGTTTLLDPLVGPGDRVVMTEAIEDFDIVELPLSGGAPRTLVNSSRYDGSPAWAPTGDTLAYVVNRSEGDEIWTRTAKGLSERRLLASSDFPDPPPDGVRALAFSPDGQWLTFMTFASHPTFRAGVWVMPASGGSPRLVSAKDAAALRSSWSPDGRSLAIDTVGPAGISMQIVGIGTSSSRRLELPPDVDARQTEWSPTGEWIAASDARAVEDSVATLLIRPSDGTVRRLPGLPGAARAWSKDGKLLYSVVAHDSSSELQTLDITTGAVRTVATYNTRLRLEDNISGTLRLSLDPTGHSFVTTMVTDRSNVWLLKGLAGAIGRKP